MKVSEQITQLKAYVPGKTEAETMREYGLSRVVKLASNENPLGPSPKAVGAAKAAIENVHRYPDPGFFELRQAFSKYYGVDPAWLGFGSGSDELIDLLTRIYCERGDAVLTSEAAFSLYKIRAQVARVDVLETPLAAGFRFDLKAMAEKLKAEHSKVRIVFIANPNNPTGTYVSRNELVEFLEVAKGYKNTLVVLDEAYCEFVRAEDYADGLELLKQYENLILLRTMSKVYGLAGLRIGTLIARPEVVNIVDRVRTSFNVNRVAQAAACAALEDAEFLNRSQQANWQGLDFFYGELDRLGVTYCRSEANFVFFDSGRDGAEVNEQLLRRGVILRPALGYGFERHLRMSVGTMEENQVAIEALEQVLK